MMHTFSTREEAVVFAAAMRSEGRYAEILDEGMGAIYGPLAIGGIRVTVSEETADEDGDGESLQMLENPTPGEATGIDKCLDVLRLFVASLAACGLITLIGIIVKSIMEDPWFARLVLYPLLKCLLAIGILFVLMGPFMGRFTRWLRGDCTSIASRAIRWLLLALMTLFVLLMFL